MVRLGLGLGLGLGIVNASLTPDPNSNPNPNHSEVGRLERLVISALITHLELQELAAATGAAARSVLVGGRRRGRRGCGRAVQLPASLTAVWEARARCPSQP